MNIKRATIIAEDGSAYEIELYAEHAIAKDWFPYQIVRHSDNAHSIQDYSTVASAVRDLQDNTVQWQE